MSKLLGFSLSATAPRPWDGAGDGADLAAKEELVNQSRQRLKDALRELLRGDRGA